MAKKTVRVEELDFYEQQKQNEEAFKQALKAVRPDIWVLMDILDETGVNYFVIFKIIRQLANLSMGTGYGTVTVSVENGKVTFVRGEDSDKVNEDLVKPKTK